MSLRRLAAPLLVGSLLILLSACAGVSVPAVTVTATVTQEPAPAKEKPAVAPQDTGSPFSDSQWEDWGYQVAEPGNLYVKFADSNEYTCGMYDCIGVNVHNARACPQMLYVEANIMSGQTVVGMTNKSFGAVAAFTDSAGVLEDYTGAGDGFRLSKVTCL